MTLFDELNILSNLLYNRIVFIWQNIILNKNDDVEFIIVLIKFKKNKLKRVTILVTLLLVTILID